MITVTEQLRRLNTAAADGELGDLCGKYRVDLLVLFGSALDSAEPGDIDLAVAFESGAGHDLLGFMDALAELVPGDHLDLMDLAHAGPVAQHRALTKCRVLFARTAASFYERQIFAINHFIETQPLRDALAHGETGAANPAAGLSAPKARAGRPRPAR